MCGAHERRCGGLATASGFVHPILSTPVLENWRWSVCRPANIGGAGRRRASPPSPCVRAPGRATGAPASGLRVCVAGEGGGQRSGHGAAPGGIARGGDVRPGGGPDAPGGGRTLRPTYARHRLVSAMEWERGRCRERGATIPPATGSRGRPLIPAASGRILGSALGSPPSKVGGPLGPVPCSPEVGDRAAAHWSRRRRPRAGGQRPTLL